MTIIPSWPLETYLIQCKWKTDSKFLSPLWESTWRWWCLVDNNTWSTRLFFPPGKVHTPLHDTILLDMTITAAKTSSTSYKQSLSKISFAHWLICRYSGDCNNAFASFLYHWNNWQCFCTISEEYESNFLKGGCGILWPQECISSPCFILFETEYFLDLGCANCQNNYNFVTDYGVPKH